MVKKPFIVLLLTFWVACAPGVDPEKEHAEKLVVHGKRELSQSQFQSASKTFALAQAYDPANEEARFGHALSEILISYEEVSLIVRAAGFGDLVPSSVSPPPGLKDEADMYNRIILQILLPLRRQMDQASAELDTISGRGFSFAVGSIPVMWNSSELVNLGGTWREGDVRLLGGLTHSIAGALDVFFAHELKFDLFDLLDYFTAYTGSFESFDFSIPELLNVVVHLFEANPEFLNLAKRDADGDGLIDGVAMPAQAHKHLRKMALDLASVREKVTQSPGLLKVGENKNNALATLTFAVARGVIEFPITQGYENGLKALAENLDGSGKLVEWKAHVLPVMAVLAAVGANTVSLLDFDLSSTVRIALGLVIDPGFVEGLVIGIVPDVIAFDPAAFFEKPAGIRSLVPLWRTGDAVPENEKVFLLEWECPYALDATAPAGTAGSILFYKADDDTAADYHLTCEKDKTIVDAPHFPVDATAPGADIYTVLGAGAIAADGIKNALPYIVFGDASLAGVLYIRADRPGVEGVNPVGSGTFEKGDLRSLNALAAQIYDSF